MAEDAINTDESKVPCYSLPDPFVSLKGDLIHSRHDWENIRRPELIHLFEEHVYGKVPGDFDHISFDLAKEDTEAMSGAAHLKEIDITVCRKGNEVTIRLILFIPKNISLPVPVFLLINHRDSVDPARKVKTDYWPAELLIERGYAAAVFHVMDVSDDNPDTFAEDILTLLYPEQLSMRDGMRGLSAWAWGAMRIMDYFESDPDIDEKRAAVIGHSRGGKAALWTGAQDTRWAITISNESGCGGAALSRRRFGETLQQINVRFPYWFADNFKSYNEREDVLPVDQHLLIACMAPRAVYVASASKDLWADPTGEFLSLRLGSRVYQDIYKIPVMLPAEFPGVNQPIHQSCVGHHIREGTHDLNRFDWEQFMDFADKFYRRRF